MARFPRIEVHTKFRATGLVPVFYHPDPELVFRVVCACADAGLETFEFTHRGDGAADVFREVLSACSRSRPAVALGVGSIVDAPTAAIYAAHGANFVVGPSFSEDVARFCNRRGIAYVPGCMTPTEIGAAEEWGSEMVKLFPCEAAGGPGFVKALLGPSPWTRLMATGLADASRESISAWIKSGVCCLGLGKELLRKEWIEQGDFSAIQSRAEELRGWIREARGS